MFFFLKNISCKFPDVPVKLKEKGSVGTLNAYTISLEILLGFERWLACSEHSPATREKYLREARWFAAWLNTLPLEKPQLIAWRDTLVGKGYTVATINGKMAAIHALLHYLGRKDCRVRPLKMQRRLFREPGRELTRGEYFRLLSAARDSGRLRLLLIMEVLGSTGIRISELCFITREAIDRGQTTVRCKGKLRTILLPRKLCRRLRWYAVERGITAGPIFRTKGGKPVDRSNVWKELKVLARRAGVEGRRVFPHNFRHLFARRFYALEKDLGKLADVLGHSSISTTRIYLMESGRAHERLLNQMKMLL